MPATRIMTQNHHDDSQETRPHLDPVDPRAEKTLQNLKSDATLVSIPRVTIPLPAEMPGIPPVIEKRLEPPSAVTTSTGVVRRREWMWVLLAVALFAVVIGGALISMLVLRSNGVTAEALPTSIAALPTAVDARTTYENVGVLSSGGAVLTLEDGERIKIEPWNGESRFTVLIMGLDRRPGETGLQYRTDTMLVASLDPQTQSVGILSIPRDLYVQVPGYSQLQRINSAMVLGELSREGNGPLLAMETVQYNFGIRIHDYIVVDFEAVIALVDAVGGVNIDVPHPIADYQFPDMNYGYDPLILSPGLQHMDGRVALKYARTRHGDSDFQRARRQQQVIFAVRDKALTVDALPGLIAQAPRLYASLSQDVVTALSLEEIIQLVLYLKDVPAERIHTGVVDANYVSDHMTADGAAVLVPHRAQLASLLTDVFGASYSQ